MKMLGLKDLLLQLELLFMFRQNFWIWKSQRPGWFISESWKLLASCMASHPPMRFQRSWKFFASDRFFVTSMIFFRWKQKVTSGSFGVFWTELRARPGWFEREGEGVRRGRKRSKIGQVAFAVEEFIPNIQEGPRCDVLLSFLTVFPLLKKRCFNIPFFTTKLFIYRAKARACHLTNIQGETQTCFFWTWFGLIFQSLLLFRLGHFVLFWEKMNLRWDSALGCSCLFVFKPWMSFSCNNEEHGKKCRWSRGGKGAIVAQDYGLGYGEEALEGSEGRSPLRGQTQWKGITMVYLPVVDEVTDENHRLYYKPLLL